MDLTPEQRALLEKYAVPNYCSEIDENGSNLSVIRENLKRSPQERLRRANRAAKSLIAVRPFILKTKHRVDRPKEWESLYNLLATQRIYN